MALDWAMLAIQFAIAVVTATVAFVLMPKPKGPKPPEVEEMKEPTASAGKPIVVPFGTPWIESPNILWFGDKETETREVKL